MDLVFNGFCLDHVIDSLSVPTRSGGLHDVLSMRSIRIVSKEVVV